jgi:hypothetical protein
MNKLIISMAMVLFFIESNAQIVLENSYPNGEWSTAMVELSNSGKKYQWLDITNGQIKLYNLNHSIFKTMNFPLAAANQLPFIYYVSENTFDLDAGIEFMVYYWDGNNLLNSETKIINEDGTILFSKIGESPVLEYSDEVASIKNTISGTKMIFNSHNDGSSKVYSLPGTLVATHLKNVNFDENNYIQPYPNPANNFIKIAYSLPSSIKEAKVTLYDATGKVIRTYLIDGNYKDLLIDTKELVDGLYLCEINSNGRKISNTEFLVKR